MIVAERKPLPEIIESIAGVKKLLVVGCNTCVAVCLAGGEREVALLSSALRIAANKDGRELDILECCIERQCEQEYNREVAAEVADVEVVLSMACGVGVQTMAQQFPNAIIYPALNTTFMGQPDELGSWSERCLGCGNCVLAQFGGICPITRCAKNLLNGPCGGSADGRCEVDPEHLECAWQLIYDRLKAIGQLDRLMEITPAKDWSPSRHGGPRQIVREDVQA